MTELEPTDFSPGSLPQITNVIHNTELIGTLPVNLEFDHSPVYGIRERIVEFGGQIISLPFAAFGRGVAREILARDHWTCTASPCFWEDVIGHPASYAEGFMLHAAHKSHDKSNPLYNTPGMGQALCVADHAIHDAEAVGAGAASLILNFGVYTYRKAAHMGYQIHLTMDAINRKRGR